MLATPYGSLDCAASTAAVEGDEWVVDWAISFDVGAFPGSHPVWMDAAGGAGDPEPRMGWVQMGTFTVTDAPPTDDDAGDDDGSGDDDGGTPDDDAGPGTEDYGGCGSCGAGGGAAGTDTGVLAALSAGAAWLRLRRILGRGKGTVASAERTVQGPTRAASTRRGST